MPELEIDRARRLRLTRMVEEREDPAVFGLIGTPKARMEKKTKLFHSLFENEVSVRSIASARATATGIQQDFGIGLHCNAIETAKL